jgi:two-component system response regulator HydG
LLVRHFIAKHAGMGSRVASATDEALDALAARDWPGNVRELENTVESAIALSPGPELTSVDLERMGGAPSLRVSSCVSSSSERAMDSLPLSLDAYERCALQRALQEADGDATAAARSLGIGRSTFYRKIAKHGIRTPELVAGPSVGVSASQSIG